MSAQQKEEGLSRNSRQLGGETGAELSSFVKFQCQEQASFFLELLRLLLKCPENLRRIRDFEAFHSVASSRTLQCTTPSVAILRQQ